MLKALVRVGAVVAFFGAIILVIVFFVGMLRSGEALKFLSAAGLCFDLYGILLLFGADNPDQFWRKREISDVQGALSGNIKKTEANADSAEQDQTLAFLNKALVRQAMLWIAFGFTLQIGATLLS